MEYDCTGVQQWLEKLEGVYEKHTRGREVERWVKPTRKEWRLEEGEEMTEDKMVVIAIARWLYHKERSALVHRQRRRLDVDRLTERVEEELEFLKEKERREEEKKREEEEKREAKEEEGVTLLYTQVREEEEQVNGEQRLQPINQQLRRRQRSSRRGLRRQVRQVSVRVCVYR